MADYFAWTTRRTPLRDQVAQWEASSAHMTDVHRRAEAAAQFERNRLKSGRERLGE